MDFIAQIKRYPVIVIILSIMSVITFSYYGLTKKDQSLKTTIFLTVATQNSSNPQDAEVAATYFGETIMGWFKNPSFVSEITQNIPEAKISAAKQERQNLLVDIYSPDLESSSKISNMAITVLKEKISDYNLASKSSFLVIPQGINQQRLKNQLYSYPLAGLLFGLILSVFLIVLKESILGQVSSIGEVESIFKKKSVDILSRKLIKNKYNLLSVAISKAKPLIILAGVSYDSDFLSLDFVHQHSIFDQDIALVDGDLSSRSLQEKMGLSQRMKKIKGHTDVNSGKTNTNVKVILQNTMVSNLKFVPAGTGEKFLAKVFTGLAKHLKTIVHTKFPENFEILKLEDASLFLVIELGKTKKSDLEKIQEVWKDHLEFIILD